MTTIGNQRCHNCGDNWPCSCDDPKWSCGVCGGFLLTCSCYETPTTIIEAQEKYPHGLPISEKEALIIEYHRQIRSLQDGIDRLKREIAHEKCPLESGDQFFLQRDGKRRLWRVSRIDPVTKCDGKISFSLAARFLTQKGQWSKNEFTFWPQSLKDPKFEKVTSTAQLKGI